MMLSSLTVLLCHPKAKTPVMTVHFMRYLFYKCAPSCSILWKLFKRLLFFLKGSHVVLLSAATNTCIIEELGKERAGLSQLSVSGRAAAAVVCPESSP